MGYIHTNKRVFFKDNRKFKLISLKIDEILSNYNKNELKNEIKNVTKNANIPKIVLENKNFKTNND